MDCGCEKLLLGIDIGTTDAKCTFYTVSGTPVGGCYREYAMIHPQVGWAEEDPASWWNAVVENLRDCFDRQHIDAARVAAIGVSCTNTFFPVDRNGNALCNAILQIDQRTREEVDWVHRAIGDERIYQITGNRIAPGTFSIPTIRWFVKNRPDVVQNAYKFLVPSGYIVCKLTGRFTINESRMGFTLLGNIHTGQWDEGLAREVGVSPEKLPKPCKAYEIVGTVTPAAAEITGLPAGIPVVGGAMDTVAAAVGAGAIHENDVFLAVGTCGRLCYSSCKENFDPRLMNCRNAFDHQWLSIEATNASGASLRWFRDVFGGVVSKDAEQRGLKIYQALDEAAASANPGAKGLLYFPYLSGERCPIWNPDARGIFFGFSLATNYGDFVRAVMEGVAFSLKQGLEIVVQNERPKFLSLGGGIANSRLWCQIFADILEYPIKKLPFSETETLGDAILAGYGIGLIKDPAGITRRFIGSAETFSPNPTAQKIYERQFKIYKDVYESVSPQFTALQAAQEAMK